MTFIHIRGPSSSITLHPQLPTISPLSTIHYAFPSTPPPPPPSAAMASFLTPPSPHFLTRRSLLLSTSLAPLTSQPLRLPPPDTTITDRIFMDFSICESLFRPDRTVSDTVSTLCTDPIPLGRLVLGLYGHLVPSTVSNFKSMVTSSAYKNTLVHKVLPGQFFVAGRQGRKDLGEVKPPGNLPRNVESVDPKAFVLRHDKAGVLSLCLEENDDEDEVKLDPDYRNVEFLITTGPAPCPQLDDKNIVFGAVLQGMDVVTAIAAIPTYKPSERIRQFNDLAEFFGDERAQNARTIWDKPLKTVYISDCGELRVAKPSLTPSLP